MKIKISFLIGLCLISLFSGKAFSQHWDWALKADAPTDGYGCAVTTDAQGNVHVAGIFTSSITFMSNTLYSSSGLDIFTVKYDTDGNFLWARQSITSGCNLGYCSGIACDVFGNTYVTGFFECPISFDEFNLYPNSGGGATVFVVKYNSDGDVVWAKSSEGTAYGNNEPSGITTDAHGNVYVTGSFEANNIIFDHDTLMQSGNSNSFIVKYSKDGDVLWVKQSEGLYSYPAAIHADIYNNIYTTGRFYDTLIVDYDTLISHQWDPYLIKYDTAGILLWAKSFGGNDFDCGSSISSDLTGNVYLGGYFKSDTILMDPLYLVNDTVNNSADIFTSKYDTDGNLLWAKRYGGVKEDICKSITSDAQGNTYITGSFYPDSTNCDILVFKNDPSANTVWSFSGTGHNYNIGFGITADLNGRVYLTGALGSSLILGDSIFYNSGGIDMFLAKLSDDITGNCSAQFSLYADTILHQYYILNYASGIPPLSYSWDWGDGSQNDTIALPSHTYSTEGVFNICLTIDDSVGCTNTYCYFFNLMKSGNSIIQVNVIYGNTGIEELSSGLLIVFPNPASDRIEVYLPMKSQIEILNMEGQVLKRMAINEDHASIDVSGFAKGIYFLKVKDDHSYTVKKFIKE
jgi:hypothetical protein